MGLEVHYFQINPFMNIYEPLIKFKLPLQVLADLHWIINHILCTFMNHTVPCITIFTQLDSASTQLFERCCGRSGGCGGSCRLSGALQFAAAARSATQSTRLTHQVFPVPWRWGPGVFTWFYSCSIHTLFIFILWMVLLKVSIKGSIDY